MRNLRELRKLTLRQMQKSTRCPNLRTRDETTVYDNWSFHGTPVSAAETSFHQEREEAIFDRPGNFNLLKGSASSPTERRSHKLMPNLDTHLIVVKGPLLPG